MTLHTPIYDERSSYCGPTAMAAVTGLPVSVIKQALREVSGKRAVMGVRREHLVLAMDKLGWRLSEGADHEIEGRRDALLFREFLDAHGRRGPFIVNVTNHYIAVSHGEACDTYTRIPIAINVWRKHRGKRHVKGWWRFEEVVTDGRSERVEEVV